LRVWERLVIAGDIVEYYRYERAVITGDGMKRKGRAGDATDEEKELNRMKVLARARKSLRRVVNANVFKWKDFKGKVYIPKFFTLTFKENIKDLRCANYEWNKFIKRLNYNLGYDLKYTVVPEFQRRGAVHYHSIVYNMGYFEAKKLEEIWGNGFIKINRIDNVDNVGAYICKYMSKELSDERLMGEKSYFNSRGLFKPIEIKEKAQVDKFLNSIPEHFKVYEKEFENEFTGKTLYVQYNMRRVKREDGEELENEEIGSILEMVI
jgi:hypothetical protein